MVKGVEISMVAAVSRVEAGIPDDTDGDGIPDKR